MVPRPPELGDFGSAARDVSGDGKRIVGTAAPAANPSEAFFWDRAGGMRSLLDAMHERGFEDMLEDWSLESAHAISADGKVVVGCASGPLAPGVRSQAYRVRLEP